MSLADFRGTDWTVNPSSAESERFGLPVARATVPREASLLGLPAAIKRADADIVILRSTADRGDAVRLPVAGYRALPAGTLMYWEARLDRVHDVESSSRLQTRIVAADDADVIRGTIAQVFAGYRNHYSVNPLFDDDLAAAGYVEWAERTVANGSAGSVVLEADGVVVGVATASSADSEWEIELAGIVPDRQRGGLYAHLLRGIHDGARHAGADRVVISTQSHNIGVQRAWARLGYEPIDAIETVHLVREGLLPS